MDLEARILSGGDFANSPVLSPKHSPGSRTPSPDPLFPADNDFSDSDISPPQFKKPLPSENFTPHINAPETGTGVKSVIRDHNEATRRDRERHNERIRNINNRLKSMALETTTYVQDEELRLLERTIEGLDQREVINTRTLLKPPGRFGHLREIGSTGFIDAIDNVPEDTWVVLHIYDPASSRCHDLDSTLARLARQYPDTKFIRTRAGAIGFTTLVPAPAPRRSTFLKNYLSKNYDEDEGYELDDHDGDDDFEDEHTVSQPEQIDPDMFPTMLVYRGGELLYTWIRVDWEADEWMKRKEGGQMDNPVEALLKGHNIIRHSRHDNCGFSSDDEDLDIEGDVHDDEIFDL